MSVTPLPPAPSRSVPSTFDALADAFIGALPTLVTEVNTTAATVSASEANAVASSAAAVAAANYKGVYAAGTTYQIGQSVTYLTKNWVAKTVNSGVTPAAGANWLEVVAIPTLTAGMILTNDGTNTSWSATWTNNPVQTLAIFSTAAGSQRGVSALERMENALVSVGLSVAVSQVHWGASLFVAVGDTSTGSVASSPDGVTWTLRTMPSSATWRVGTDGTGFVATIAGATGTATSANGTTWTAATALPGSGASLYGSPVFIGSTCWVYGGTSTVYTSTNYGSSWSTQTLPADMGTTLLPFVVGGLVWYFVGGVTAYTSATGLTGSYTVRTLPVTPGIAWQGFDGALFIQASGSTTAYKSTDGINWTSLTTTWTGYPPLFQINNIWAQFSTTFGSAQTYHAGLWVRRTSSLQVLSALLRPVKNTGGTVFLIPQGSTAGIVARIEPAAADAAKGIFITP